MNETHPFHPFIDDNTRKLIIGTTPPMRFTQGHDKHPEDVDFYYGSRDNYFWDLMGDVFKTTFSRDNSYEAIEKRKEFMRKEGIGFADIVLEFHRNLNNASDKNLHVIRFQNIYEILKNYPRIEKVLFTGYSGRNSAESLTSRHLGEHGVFNSIVSKTPPKHKIFNIDGREIHSFSLFSPSPAARKKYEVILNQYKSIFKNSQ